MANRRVVITGLGPISPNVEGKQGKEEFFNAITHGVSGVHDIPPKLGWLETLEFPVRKVANLVGFSPEEYGVNKKDARRLDSIIVYAAAAANLALSDAGLLGGLGQITVQGDRVGVIIGIGMGGSTTLDNHTHDFNEAYFRHIAKKEAALASGAHFTDPVRYPVNLFYIVNISPNMSAGKIAKQFGITGDSFTVNTACASGTNAIGLAYNSIAYGDLDTVLTGGAEAPLIPTGIKGFHDIRALSQLGISRPFDAQRDGFVAGEGAGMLVLESLDHARARGVRIYAEVVGYASTTDIRNDLTGPDEDGNGLQRAILNALRRANVSVNDVDHINAHGTSTELNDKTETYVFKQVFGERAYQIPVTAVKSMTGHLLGGAGGIETIALALAIDRGVISPTVNYANRDPLCGLDYVPNEKRVVPVRVGIKTSSGFGGHNAVLVLRKYWP